MILTFDVSPDTSVTDQDIIVTVDVTYAPAKLSGPPEDCHPDESEVELLSWTHNGLTPDEREAVDRWLNSEDGIDRVNSEAWEQFIPRMWEQRHEEYEG